MDNDALAALMAAAETGDIDGLKALLAEGADPNAREKNERTALWFAVLGKHTECVKALLAAGANPNERVDGRTALMFNQSPETVKALIAGGADVNASDSKYGSTPLSSANHAESVRALVTAGANTGATDKFGMTALINFAKEGRVDCATALLAAGADPNVKTRDNLGKTALHCATFKFICADRPDKSTSTIEALLAGGADINSGDNSGETALHYIAKEIGSECLELARTLIARGANVNARDCYGDTPLHVAARGGVLHEEIVKLLLDSGADPNATNQSHRTPLEEAEEGLLGGDRVVELLEPHTKPSAPVTIWCAKCGTVYKLGVDAISLTARELAGMMPGLVGTVPDGLMIGRSHQRDEKQLRKDRRTVLSTAPRTGWTCQKCHHDNQWRPGAPPISSRLKRLLHFSF